MSHTPLPWFKVAHSDKKWTIQDKENGAGNCVAVQYMDSDEANAYFIVTACNAHYGLVDQIGKLKQQVEAGKKAGRAMLKQEMERTKIVIELREKNEKLVDALRRAIDEAIFPSGLISEILKTCGDSLEYKK